MIFLTVTVCLLDTKANTHAQGGEKLVCWMPQVLIMLIMLALCNKTLMNLRIERLLKPFLGSIYQIPGWRRWLLGDVLLTTSFYHYSSQWSTSSSGCFHKCDFINWRIQAELLKRSRVTDPQCSSTLHDVNPFKANERQKRWNPKHTPVSVAFCTEQRVSGLNFPHITLFSIFHLSLVVY